ncbi:MAG: TetR/AcrR family transcriptional regulator [Novosphingobium meiothermophilum]|uniref:TetR/AcrR family transcriptional regulator n=1 Tax=Novosphingobium TaxID=165696 RepID=UPI000D6EA174|nr:MULTISPECIES: TetR/AcrR family transcriptional regulator [Novosphingobium]
MPLSRTRIARPARQPRPAGEKGPQLQAAKAAQTRARLIEATIRCLVKFGYANTTTPKVAEEAGLSRGAMMHHFENGTALIKAAIAELHDKRLRAFRRAADKPVHEVTDLVETYWRQLQKPAFIAFHELAVAARTDADLASILKPLQDEFAEKFNAQAEQLFPEWASSPENFALAMTLSQTILEGMAISLQTGGMDAQKVEPMLRHLEQQIANLAPPAPNPEMQAQASDPQAA